MKACPSGSTAAKIERSEVGDEWVQDSLAVVQADLISESKVFKVRRDRYGLGGKRLKRIVGQNRRCQGDAHPYAWFE